MPSKELGAKYVCFKCGTKFYDLKKVEPLCPKCGADQRQSPALKPAAPERRVRPPARPVVPVPAESEPDVSEDAELDEDEEEVEDVEQDDEQ